ncbi:MAG TPA: HNH endonuclease signature motif containing protein [Gammaproteobacteria bacterium]
MRFWWFNQNQTFRQETEGGYLWSPKRNANGGKNPFYEFMREAAPGDFVFSFEGTHIRAVGIARSNAYESPKPPEFGNAGPNWNRIGWRMDMRFERLDNQIRPSDYMQRLLPVLPPRYSPLQTNGRGNQGVYLTAVPPMMADILVSLIGEQAIQLRKVFSTVTDYEVSQANDTALGLVEWEEYLINEIKKNDELPETERETLILARRGQGVFEQNVLKIESKCRVTEVDRIEHLRASHIKPWRDCEDAAERLAAGNGLLLTPSIDHLFDRGFISFENNGSLLISPAAHQLSLKRMGIETDKPVNVGKFNDEQRHFLNYHREQVFLEARISR